MVSEWVRGNDTRVARWVLMVECVRGWMSGLVGMVDNVRFCFFDISRCSRATFSMNPYHPPYAQRSSRQVLVTCVFPSTPGIHGFIFVAHAAGFSAPRSRRVSSTFCPAHAFPRLCSIFRDCQFIKVGKELYDMFKTRKVDRGKLGNIAKIVLST